jgi:transcriptional regulator with XRE-family HTH domain
MDKLRTARRLAGLSQNEAAKRLNTTEKSIARWERGETDGWMRRLDDLAAAYGTTREALLPDNPAAKGAPEDLADEVARLRREVEELRTLVVGSLAAGAA